MWFELGVLLAFLSLAPLLAYHRSVAPKSGEKRKQPAGVVSDSEGHAPLAKRPRHGVYDRWQHDDLEAPEEIPKDYLLSVRNLGFLRTLAPR